MLDTKVAVLLNLLKIKCPPTTEDMTERSALMLYNNIIEAGMDSLIAPEFVGQLVSTIAETDDEFFRVASRRAVEIGAVEELSYAGYQQAVKNIAYHLAMTAIEQIESGADDAKRVITDIRSSPQLMEKMRTLDQVYAMTSYGAGIPPRIVDRDVSKSLDEYLFAYIVKRDQNK